MARLQILNLPAGAGDDQPPFALVIDQYHPQRYVRGVDQGEPEVVDEFAFTADQIGARAVLVFAEPVEIPANEPPLTALSTDGDPGSGDPELAELVLKTLGIELAPGGIPLAEALHNACRQLEESEAARKHLRRERADARMWARHGYEIGQKHCGWVDHGVAPDWLTEGWPPAFDSCRHLKEAAELDAALSRVRSLPTKPDAMNAQQEHPGVWLHGYECGVRAARAAAVPRDEEASS